MPLTPLDVLDTAVKIGLGSLITAISGFFILKTTHSHENKKELKNHYYKLQEERKIKYIEFSSQSQSLVQEYLNSCCNCQGNDYKKYLRTYNEVQVISQDHIRTLSFELMSAVNQFITFDHSREINLSKKMRQAVNDYTGKFLALAQNDVTKPYSQVSHPKT